MLLKIKRKNVENGLQLHDLKLKYTGINDTVDILASSNKELAESLKKANELLKNAKKIVRETTMLTGKVNKTLEIINMLNSNTLESELAIDMLTNKGYKLPYLSGNTVEMRLFKDKLYVNYFKTVVFNGKSYKVSATQNFMTLDFQNQDFLKVDVLELVEKCTNEENRSILVQVLNNCIDSDSEVQTMNINTISNENKSEVEQKIQELNLKFDSVLKALEVYDNETVEK